MNGIACKLLVHSNAVHLQQVYTGFFLLWKSRQIDLSQEIVKRDMDVAAPSGQLRLAGLRVVVNGRLRLYYDTHDSGEIDEQALEESDCYFKRSYCPQRVAALGVRGRTVRPLGLNYRLHPGRPDRLALKRNLAWSGRGLRKKARAALAALNCLGRKFYLPRVPEMWSPPPAGLPPRVLFLTRAWDPYDKPGRMPETVARLEGLNDLRAECISTLRKAFGSDFLGGFAHSPFAAEKYPGLLVSDPAQTSPRRYLELLRDFPLCVATTGLHGSIGWKFAEYVAFARAILSEPLNFTVPGPMSDRDNYLVFRSPEELVEQTARLRDDPDLRGAMMAANAAYYQSHLRPDRLILNTLDAAGAF